MGKKIRLLALDLDGTLLNGAKQITPRTQAALERARQQGVLMVPVTGRPAQGLPPAVLSLPEKYRLPVHLFYYEGYSIAETAAVLGRRESTVRAQLTRARAMLREKLEVECI